MPTAAVAAVPTAGAAVVVAVVGLCCCWYCFLGGGVVGLVDTVGVRVCVCVGASHRLPGRLTHLRPPPRSTRRRNAWGKRGALIGRGIGTTDAAAAAAAAAAAGERRRRR